MFELYLLWNESSISFMWGLSLHHQEKRIEVCLGIIAIGINYGTGK
jgi:hypothetical protein